MFHYTRSLALILSSSFISSILYLKTKRISLYSYKQYEEENKVRFEKWSKSRRAKIGKRGIFFHSTRKSELQIDELIEDTAKRPFIYFII